MKLHRLIAAVLIGFFAWTACQCGALAQSAAGGTGGGGGGGAANPYPGSDYANAANQVTMSNRLGAVNDPEAQTGDATLNSMSNGQRAILTNLLTSYGALADAAATTGNGSMIALTKALRDKLVSGTLAVNGTVTANQGGSWTVNLGTIAGVATATNQSAEIAALGAMGDAACATDAGNCSINSVAKRITTLLNGPTPSSQSGPSLGPTSALGVTPQDGLIPAGSPFSQSAAATLFSIDTTGYQSIAVQLSGTFSATTAYEVSNDNINYFSAVGMVSSVNNNGAAGTTTGTGVVYFPVVAKYFRSRVSAYTSGTVVAVPVLRSTPLSLPQAGVAVTNSPTVLLGAVTPNTTVGGIGVNATASPNGLTNVSRIVSAAASNNATLAKATSGRLYKITGFNAAGSIRWLKFYNKATAPVPGTDTPFFQVAIPPGVFSYDGQDIGFQFTTGIGYALTTGAADNDNTAVTAADVMNLNVWYN